MNIFYYIVIGGTILVLVGFFFVLWQIRHVPEGEETEQGFREIKK